MDTQDTLWRGTNQATPPTQLAFAVNLGYATSTTLTDATALGTNLPFKIPFESNLDGSFAQPLVIVLIAVPLVLQSYGIFFLSALGARWLAAFVDLIEHPESLAL